MDQKQQMPDKIKWTGLWLKTRVKSGDKYWSSTLLRPPDIEAFLSFTIEPTKIMMFRNLYKQSERHPDATIMLYRHQDTGEWMQRREEIQEVREVDVDSQFESKNEDAPF